MRLQPFTTLLLVATSACALSITPGGGQVDGDRDVEITLAKRSYSWNEVANGGGPQGTVKNASDRTIYLLAGDRMAGETQTQLMIAMGSDVTVEARDGGSWKGFQGAAMLFEGVGLVRMPPGATYQLRGGFGSERATGTYRIRVDYYTDRDRSASAKGSASSATFEVD